ncbi:hypothetical protein [Parafilimonas sp.]|uniref:hypothetical protein n=1 Tax=Parafilimonas sp. TaxID=1969739 RepID=UPI0039E38497
MDELNKIWNADEEDLNEEQLMNYLNGKLTDEEANAFEKKMAGSAFINEGVEGLQQFSSSEKIDIFTKQLNDNLRKKTAARKLKMQRSFKGLSWELMAIIAVIILALIGYAVIQFLNK